MHYEKYKTHIVQAYGVELRGWPEGIPFMTPSNIKGIAQLRTLRDALDSGKCHWHELTTGEIQRQENTKQTAANAGEEPSSKQKERSDKGKKRVRKVTSLEGDASRRKCRKVSLSQASSSHLPPT